MPLAQATAEAVDNPWAAGEKEERDRADAAKVKGDPQEPYHSGETDRPA